MICGSHHFKNGGNLNIGNIYNLCRYIRNNFNLKFWHNTIEDETLFKICSGFSIFSLWKYQLILANAFFTIDTSKRFVIAHILVISSTIWFHLTSTGIQHSLLFEWKLIQGWWTGCSLCIHQGREWNQWWMDQSANSFACSVD